MIRREFQENGLKDSLPVRVPIARTVFKKALEQKKRLSHPGKSEFLSYLETAGSDEHGNPLNIDAHTQLIANTIAESYAKGSNVSIVVAPGFGKSTIARHFLLWIIGKKNEIRSTIVMGSEQDASESVALCRDIVVSRKYKTVFPEIRYDYTVEEQKRKNKSAGRSGEDELSRGFKMNAWYLRTKGQRKDPTMASAPIELKGESKRSDITLFDDVIGEEVASSITKLEKVKKAFYNTWVEGRLSNGGSFIYLQNLRNKQDLSHKLRADKRVCSLWIGVEDDLERMFVRFYNPPKGLSAIDNPEIYGLELSVNSDMTHECDYEFTMPKPTRIVGEGDRQVDLWSKDYLSKRDPRAFQVLYKLKVLEGDELMFSSFPSRRLPGGNISEIFNIPSTGDIPVCNDSIMARYSISGGLDWSGQKRKGKAVTFLIRDNIDGRICAAYYKKISGDIKVVVDTLQSIYNLGFRWHVLMAESNAVQDELNNAVRELSKDSSGIAPDWVYTIVDFQTTNKKWDMEHGLPQINIAFETGKFVWPRDMASRHRDWADLEADFSEMTIERLKMTPDGIMSTWLAWRGLHDRCSINASNDSNVTEVIDIVDNSSIVF